MKKTILILIAIIILLSDTITTFAGDVPEALLADDSSQTFIGEVKEITEDSITIIQKHNFKGEFTEGSEVKYDFNKDRHKTMSVGENVLFGYFNESGDLYTFKIKSFENGKLILADDYEMTKRLEEYINNGDFAKAEEERLAKQSENVNENTKNEIEISNKTTKDMTNTVIFTTFGGAAIFFILGAVFVIIRKGR